MKNEVILNKISTIERCLKRIQDVYGNDPENLEDYTKQDSIILNIQRACEASIDLAMHIVAGKNWGYLNLVEKLLIYWLQQDYLAQSWPIS